MALGFLNRIGPSEAVSTCNYYVYYGAQPEQADSIAQNAVSCTQEYEHKVGKTYQYIYIVHTCKSTHTPLQTHRDTHEIHEIGS